MAGRTAEAAASTNRDPAINRPDDPRVSVLIPAYDEAANLEVVLPALPAVHEVIVVDAHSTDGTVATVHRVMPRARVIEQTRTGKGNAVACGLAVVTGDVVVMFDADGSNRPCEIARFVQALRDGADFAKGSRYLDEGGSTDITLTRSAGNKALSEVANVLFHASYTDLCYGYNAFWTDLIPHLDLPDPSLEEPQWGDGFEIETLINARVAKLGLRVVEVPSLEMDRISGHSHLHTFKDGARVLRTLVHEKREQ